STYITHGRAYSIVIYDTILWTEPLLPADRTDPRLDRRAERARKPYLSGSFTLLAAPRAMHDHHVVNVIGGGLTFRGVRTGRSAGRRDRGCPREGPARRRGRQVFPRGRRRGGRMPRSRPLGPASGRAPPAG